jgi:hypothetical protein
MLLMAKVALGLCGTVAFAGAYTFHEGVMRVDADTTDGRHVHVWVPAAVIPMAMHVVPGRYLERATSRAGEWLPTLRALTTELEKYPEADLVQVDNADEHVHIRTHNGKLLVDVTGPDENVHVACPLAMMEDLAEQLESRSGA